jgi:hypothetical protein
VYDEGVELNLGGCCRISLVGENVGFGVKRGLYAEQCLGNRSGGAKPKQDGSEIWLPR